MGTMPFPVVAAGGEGNGVLRDGNGGNVYV